MRRTTAMKLLLILIALLAAWGSAFQLWRYPARLRAVLRPGDYHVLGFSEDGESFLTAETRDERATFRVWDVRTGQILFSLDDKRTEIEDLTTSPDAKFLARWNVNDGLKLWDVAKDTARILIKNTDDLSRPELQFSADSRLLVINFPHPTYQIRIVDAKTGYEIGTFKDTLGAFAFAPKSQTLAWVASDSKLGDVTLRLWNRLSNHVKSRVIDHQVHIGHISFSPDGQVLATASYSEKMEKTTVKLWNAETLEILASFVPDKDSIDRIFFSPSGRLLVVDGIGGGVVSSIMDMRFMPPKKLAEFTGTPLFTRDGEELLTIQLNKDVIELWDSKTMRKCASFRYGKGSLPGSSWFPYGFRLSPDGRLVALHCEDKGQHVELADWIGQQTGLWDQDYARQSVRVWDLKANRELAGFRGCQAVCFSAKGDAIATYSQTEQVEIWEWPPVKPGEYLVGLCLSILLLVAVLGSSCYRIARSLWTGRGQNASKRPEIAS